jgi:hypothetical protein
MIDNQLLILIVWLIGSIGQFFFESMPATREKISKPTFIVDIAINRIKIDTLFEHMVI